jgi:Bifunctional DNA primase/polymerase, N-terminal
MTGETPPPPSPAEPPHPGLVLPDSFLALETVEQTLDVMLAASLWPILVHAPIGTDGRCTCGKTHQKSALGSSSAGKHPIAKSWQSKIASRDELLDQLARLKFTPNVGVVLGRQPSDHYLLAVDVDDLPRFAVLEQELGPLPDTARCDSGRGYRLIYELPHSIDTSNVVNVTGLLGEPGVDVKIKAGQVVVAPSLHASGRRYVWSRAGAVAPLPMAWALEIVTQPKPPEWASKYTPSTLYKDNRARSRAEKYLESALTGNARVIAACGVGMRNSTLFKLACRMFEMCASLQLSRSWDHVYSELLSAAKASGLHESEVRGTLDSADKRIRESGKIQIPVVLQDPDPTRPTVPPPALDDVDRTTEPAPPPEEGWAPLPAFSSTGLPIIRITSNTDAIVSAAEVVLHKAGNIFQREGQLVFIARVLRDGSNDYVDEEIDRPVPGSSPQIRSMTNYVIKRRLSKVAIFQRWVDSSQRYKPVSAPDDMVGNIHDSGEWPRVDVLDGIIETPIMRNDGVIVQGYGYDAKTKYVYMPNETFPTIRDEDCTQQNAKWAFGLLSEVFEDFPYVNASHRSVPVAAILTLMARPAIAGSVPAFLFDASTRGSGKTLQTDAIATVVTGRGAPRMNYTSDEIELEKILGGYAIKGSQFVCLDNVPPNRPFGGGPMDRILTARDKVELRLLGHNDIVALAWRAVIMATGNNMSLFGDTARRSLMARLEPGDEKPELRTKFKHDDLLAWVRAQRPRLVGAALLILRAYWRAGRPAMGCARWGSFEEWSRLIPNAIMFAGGADPTKARPECDEDVDTETRSIRYFIKTMHGLIGSEPFRVGDIIELLYQCERKPRRPDELPPPPPSPGTALIQHHREVRQPDENGHERDGLEDLRDAMEALVGRRGMTRWAKGEMPNAVELGKRLSAFRGRILDGLRLASHKGAGGILRWAIVQPYQISTT